MARTLRNQKKFVSIPTRDGRLVRRFPQVDREIAEALRQVAYERRWDRSATQAEG